MTKIQEWINNNLKVEAGQYKDFTENMERQCPVDIVGPYRDWDPTELWDWKDRIVFSYYLDHFSKDAKILDVGFGDGWPSLLIAPEVGEVIGIDIAEQRVRKAKENQARRGIKNTQFLQMSSEEMEFADNTFDGVFSCSCIEQTDSFATVQEIYRVLKPGGIAIGSLQDLTQFAPGEYFSRMSPDCSKKSTYGDYIITYSICDVENLQEFFYILFISEKLDQLIQEEISDSTYLHLNEEQTKKLEELLKEYPAEIERCLTYTTNHLSIPKVEEYLKAAGFREVSIFYFTNLIKMLKVIQGWQDAGTLEEIGNHFQPLTQGFKDLLEVESGVNPKLQHIQFRAVK